MKRESYNGGLFAKLRFREKQIGTTWSARQDMRIRYVPPVDEVTALGATLSLAEYRDL